MSSATVLQRTGRLTTQSEVYELKGHSGCRILLMMNGANAIVRKIARDAAYNVRLERQRDGQLSLSSLGIPTPCVLGSGFEEGLFYFDMEYVNNRVLSQYVLDAKYTEVDRALERIFGFLRVLRARQHSVVKAGVFTAKIAELRLHPGLACSAEIGAILRNLEAYDWDRIPCSPCHGDLTFENILVTDDGPVVIDTLDSFASSWLLDLAKLYQDAVTWWAYRDQPINRSNQVRLVAIARILDEHTRQLGLSDYEWASLRELLMLNTLRIIPYCRTSDHHEFLMASLEHLSVISPLSAKT